MSLLMHISCTSSSAVEWPLTPVRLTANALASKHFKILLGYFLDLPDGKVLIADSEFYHMLQKAGPFPSSMLP